MKELLTVVTRKGQITVPAEIRRALHLKEGDKVAISLTDKQGPAATPRAVRSVAEMTLESDFIAAALKMLHASSKAILALPPWEQPRNPRGWGAASLRTL